MSRPDHVKCIERYHSTEEGTSYCGRDVRSEWHFLAPTHAAYTAAQGSHLRACGECVDVVIKMLEAARYAP